MVIRCPKCGGEFSPASLQFKTIAEGDLEFEATACPKCDHMTLTLITDSELRNGIRQYRQIAHIIENRRERKEAFSPVLERERIKVRNANDARRKDLYKRFSWMFPRIVGDLRV